MQMTVTTSTVNSISACKIPHLLGSGTGALVSLHIGNS